MDQLNHMLDDALAGFDEDDEYAPAKNSVREAAASASPAAVGRYTVGPLAGTARGQDTTAATGAAPSESPDSQSAAHGDSRTADSASSSQQLPAAAASSSAPSSSSSSSKPFDPLKRKSKNKTAEFGAAAGLGSGLKSSKASKVSSSSSSARRPALTPEVHKLQDDLAQLMSEWSAAMHPQAEQAEQQAAGHKQKQQQQQGVSAVLAALAEQTQRTVQEQSRLRPPPAGAAAAADGSSSSGGGGGGDQMNMIVDVVMQHLLSKEVLYQPMKEIMEKYPPWLEKHSAPGSSSNLSPADLARYQQQYACITRLCEAYETEPDNTAKIMQLLQEMQACGEPPADIVEEMSAAIAADLPADASAGDVAGGGLDLEGLGDLPQELKNCPVQ